MPEMDGRYGRASSHQPDSAPPRNRDVLRRVFGFHSTSEESVIHFRYGFAELCNSSDGRVVTVIDRHRQRFDSGRSTRKRASFGLPLAEIDPVGIIRAKAAFFGFRRDIDDAGTGYRP